MAWSWERQGSHINEMEAIDVLLQHKAKSRSQKCFASVYLHLVDSQVSIGVFTKKKIEQQSVTESHPQSQRLVLGSPLAPSFHLRQE